MFKYNRLVKSDLFSSSFDILAKASLGKAMLLSFSQLKALSQLGLPDTTALQPWQLTKHSFVILV